ncbi:sulfotransferase family protein [Yoonia sediminilitoris]|uniref:Sulfotransferase family protein n=2 Tax=Yoonia sediminilitoris TaxID=1286148 RepID=A0A2T6KR93_9RHOB|nr:sulfotransferase family protein [Yoonia sediminilitoris]RCW99238.1 sulfotransferase family protein [Yoonia sediminilitoris]
MQAFRIRLRELRDIKEDALEADRGWQVANMDRRINDMKALMKVLEGDRTRDLGYATWLLDRRPVRLVADITPNYATLPETTLSRMAQLAPTTKFIFLMRDPLDRLWSHIRMQARRQRQSHEIYAQKANNILHRIINRGQETHILERGDYPAIISRLRSAVPPDRLKIIFTEDMMGQDALSLLCEFLGISHVKPTFANPVHEGPQVVMLEKLRPKAQKLLNEHYTWVADNVGPLPLRWQENLARA